MEAGPLELVIAIRGMFDTWKIVARCEVEHWVKFAYFNVVIVVRWLEGVGQCDATQRCSKVTAWHALLGKLH
jgi:hypothetical protein